MNNCMKFCTSDGKKHLCIEHSVCLILVQCTSIWSTICHKLSVKEKKKRVSYKYRQKINATGTGCSQTINTFACIASLLNVNPEYHWTHLNSLI